MNPMDLVIEHSYLFERIRELDRLYLEWDRALRRRDALPPDDPLREYWWKQSVRAWGKYARFRDQWNEVEKAVGG
jgi:hypothetical protein